ncbi:MULTISPECIES: hypothetical protein [unclassified Paenibacillus]|uniref:hypothetical protein n=1 Tax=unclassified Paenibacillus TaxID=185978 RepID=UPI0013FD2830|nr:MULTISPECIES: hypothetical protein [unclassified Paenibacillus]
MIITFVTRTDARNEFDVEIKYWQQAGLKSPSQVRTSKPTTILKSEVKQDPVRKNRIIVPRGFIGKLHKEDL